MENRYDLRRISLGKSWLLPPFFGSLPFLLGCTCTDSLIGQPYFGLHDGNRKVMKAKRLSIARIFFIKWRLCIH